MHLIGRATAHGILSGLERTLPPRQPLARGNEQMQPMNNERLMITAANDNDPFWRYEAGDDFIAPDAEECAFIFAPEVADRLGLTCRKVSYGFLDYLLDGQVAPEDEAASEHVIALMDRHAGPGWR
ncbi:hypothetical protein [Rhizobium sp. RU20A]|uniref:hypothetical protein n=1 Tax=Rhizobium sp. RU20A TaxID=1907412 RepID=UPI00122CAEBF|nr:hypothetical protein [Rhizobium sp. RU20A]